MRSIRFLLILASFFVMAYAASATVLDKTTLIGRWDCISYTLMQKGKPFGTVQFKPGTMLFTYRENGTWEMEANDATHKKLNGSYQIRGTELIMKKEDGSPYQDFDVELKNDGKGMVMKDKHSVLSMSKAEAGL